MKTHLALLATLAALYGFVGSVDAASAQQLDPTSPQDTALNVPLLSTDTTPLLNSNATMLSVLPPQPQSQAPVQSQPQAEQQTTNPPLDDAQEPLAPPQLPSLSETGPIRLDELNSPVSQQLEDLMKQFPYFSGTVLVAQGPTVYFQEAYGMADVERHIPNDKHNTKFMLASVTKQFTAVLVLKMVDEGKLSLTDPVTMYLTDAPRSWNRITIEMLLNHTSGLRDYMGFLGRTICAHHDTAEQIYSILKRTRIGVPGKRYLYSNSNYLLLALILEKISGQTMAQLLQQEITIPLQMTNTGRLSDITSWDGFATGYRLVGRRPTEEDTCFDASSLLGVGDMYSTTDDLFRWERALFAESTNVVSDNLKKAMFTPSKAHNYGFGFHLILQNDGRTLIWHTGHINGHVTLLAHFLEDNVTFIILSNIGHISGHYIPIDRIYNAMATKIFSAPELFSKVRLFQAEDITPSDADVADPMCAH